MNMPMHIARKPSHVPAAEMGAGTAELFRTGHEGPFYPPSGQCPTVKLFLPQTSLPRICHSARLEKSTWLPPRACRVEP